MGCRDSEIFAEDFQILRRNSRQIYPLIRGYYTIHVEC